MKDAINKIFQEAERMINLKTDWERGFWEERMIIKQLEDSITSMQQELQGIEKVDEDTNRE